MNHSGEKLPILYTFRRCPYAMRARIALAQAGIRVELREVLLKDKPDEMRQVSPKATVPVFVHKEQVIDESIDLMRWALEQRDPNGWLQCEHSETLIQTNDSDFKAALDCYKYHTRHPEQPREYFRAQGEQFLQLLENRLEANHGAGLTGDSTALADIAIFPFIRQFAGADKAWFSSAPYPLLQKWLEMWVNSPLFNRIMKKYEPWVPGEVPVIEEWQEATA